MRRLIPRLTIGLILLCGAGGVAAKGQTRRLVVTGVTRQAPIEITNPDALANVWSGTFIGEPASVPAATLPRYAASFYVVLPRETADRLMYVVSYVRDPDEVGGVVCLPGPGAPTYALNVRTILRPDQDGRCHRAEARWSRAINAALR